MKAKNLWVILLILACFGILGAFGYMLYYGKYAIAVGILCAGVFVGIAGYKIIKEVFKTEPKVDEFTASHTSTPPAKKEEVKKTETKTKAKK